LLLLFIGAGFLAVRRFHRDLARPALSPH
jgi:hypothetical protein